MPPGRAWRDSVAARPAAARTGFTKTNHRDHGLGAFAAWRLGRPDEARAFIRSSLALHPYYTPTFKLGTHILQGTEPHTAHTFLRAYEHVMHEATAGFEEPHPSIPQAPHLAGGGTSQ